MIPTQQNIPRYTDHDLHPYSSRPYDVLEWDSLYPSVDRQIAKIVNC